MASCKGSPSAAPETLIKKLKQAAELGRVLPRKDPTQSITLTFLQKERHLPYMSWT
jgi:hypothetical protein